MPSAAATVSLAPRPVPSKLATVGEPDDTPATASAARAVVEATPSASTTPSATPDPGGEVSGTVPAAGTGLTDLRDWAAQAGVELDITWSSTYQAGYRLLSASPAPGTEVRRGQRVAVEISTQIHPTLQISDATLDEGDTLRLRGTDFLPGDTVTITGPNSAIGTTTVRVRGDGWFDASIDLPTGSGSIDSTPITLDVSTAGGWHGSAGPVTITAQPKLTAPARARIGQTISIHGSRFAPGTDLDLVIDNAKTVRVSTDADGAFTYRYRLGADVATGTHTFSAAGRSASVVVLGPIVAPAVHADSDGDTLTFSGTGFLGLDPVRVEAAHNGHTVSASVVPDADGSWSWSLDTTAYGTWTVSTRQGLWGRSTTVLAHLSPQDPGNGDGVANPGGTTTPGINPGDTGSSGDGNGGGTGVGPAPGTDDGSGTPGVGGGSGTGGTGDGGNSGGTGPTGPTGTGPSTSPTPGTGGDTRTPTRPATRPADYATGSRLDGATGVAGGGTIPTVDGADPTVPGTRLGASAANPLDLFGRSGTPEPTRTPTRPNPSSEASTPTGPTASAAPTGQARDGDEEAGVDWARVGLTVAAGVALAAGGAWGVRWLAGRHDDDDTRPPSRAA